MGHSSFTRFISCGGQSSGRRGPAHPGGCRDPWTGLGGPQGCRTPCPRHLSHLLVVVVAEIQLVRGHGVAGPVVDVVRVCGEPGTRERELSPQPRRESPARGHGAGAGGAPTWQGAAQDLRPQADGAVLEPGLRVDADVAGHHRRGQQVQHRRLGVLVPREDLGGGGAAPACPRARARHPGGGRGAGAELPAGDRRVTGVRPPSPGLPWPPSSP